MALFVGSLALPAQAQLSEDIKNGLDKIGAATGLNNTTFASIPDTISLIFNTVITFSGVIFLFLLLFGGLTYLTAAGNEEGTTKAKKMMINAIVGLAITLAAWGIGTFILRTVGYTGVGETSSGDGSNNNWVKFKVINSSAPGAVPVSSANVEINNNLKGTTKSNGETTFQITNPQSIYKVRVFKTGCAEYNSNEPLDLGPENSPSLRTIPLACP